MIRRATILAALACAANAADPADPADPVTEASRLLAEGLPALAAARLEPALTASTPATLRLLYAEARLAAGNPAAAEFALRGVVSPAAEELRGRAAFALGDPDAALAHFAASSSPAAVLAKAECLAATGRPHAALEAASALDPSPEVQLRRVAWMIDAGRHHDAAAALRPLARSPGPLAPWVLLLNARLALAEGDPARVVALGEEILRGETRQNPRLFSSAAFLLADAREVLAGPETASASIEDLITAHPWHPDLPEAFAKLDALYARQTDPSDNALARWSEDEESPRKAFAFLYRAAFDAREGKSERALRRLDRFVAEHRAHPALSLAHRMRAALLAADGRAAEALHAAEDSARTATNPADRAKAEMVAGLTHLRAGDPLLAASLFRSAAGPSAIRPAALYNLALCFAALGNEEEFDAARSRLAAEPGAARFAADLRLEEALRLARAENDRAAATFAWFLRENPAHPRAGEARAALADLAFLAGDDRDAISRILQTAGTSLEDTSAEHADYLAVFVAERSHPDDPTPAAEAARAFLRAHPSSARAPEMRLKLGQLLFSGEDYVAARAEFESLAATAPSGPFAEAACYLAGLSALRSMNPDGEAAALALFDQAAKKNGALRLHARARQAAILAAADRHDEAITVFNGILDSTRAGEMRLEALAGKADALIAKAASESAAAVQAIETLDAILAAPDAGAPWKARAYYRKASALDLLDRDQEALSALYDAVEAGLADEGATDFFWFYRAGFEAARRLEAESSWSTAVGVYERLASKPGPRAAEARSRAETLRLLHFIWD